MESWRKKPGEQRSHTTGRGSRKPYGAIVLLGLALLSAALYVILRLASLP